MDYRPRFPAPANWQDFEQLCFNLWKDIWGSSVHIQRYGRQGQRQHGLDIYWDKHGEWGGIQCKLRSVLTEKDVRDDVEKAKSFKQPLKQLIIATTAPADVAIQDLATEITTAHTQEGRFKVWVYAWQNIEDLLLSHRPEDPWGYYPQRNKKKLFLEAQFLAEKYQSSPKAFPDAAERYNYTLPFNSCTPMERWYDLLQHLDLRNAGPLPELQEYQPEPFRRWTRRQLSEELAVLPQQDGDFTWGTEGTEDAAEMLRLWAVAKCFPLGKAWQAPFLAPIKAQLDEPSAAKKRPEILQTIQSQGRWLKGGDFCDPSFAAALAADTLLTLGPPRDKECPEFLSHFDAFMEDLPQYSARGKMVFSYWLQWTTPTRWNNWLESWLRKEGQRKSKGWDRVLPRLISLDRILLGLDQDREWGQGFPFSLRYCLNSRKECLIAHCLAAMGESRLSRYRNWFLFLSMAQEAEALRVGRLIRLLLESEHNIALELEPHWVEVIRASMPGAAVDEITQACQRPEQFQRWLVLLPLALFPEAEEFLQHTLQTGTFPDPSGGLRHSIELRLAGLARQQDVT